MSKVYTCFSFWAPAARTRIGVAVMGHTEMSWQTRWPEKSSLADFLLLWQLSYRSDSQGQDKPKLTRKMRIPSYLGRFLRKSHSQAV